MFQELRFLIFDFRKVLDTIEWNFLMDTIYKFNFGSDVKNQAKIFYNIVTSCVSSNDRTSEFFAVRMDVTQGCTLPGLLFVKSIEVLANGIRNENTINGVKVIDDTTVFVQDLDSSPELLTLLK